MRHVQEYKGDPINAYLRAHNPAADPDPKGPTFGVDKEVREGRASNPGQ